MKKSDERRLAENEVIFRQINKDADDFLHDTGVQNFVLVPFLCECSNIHCQERIELPPTEYKRIHEDTNRFIVRRGHDVPKIERIVERHDTYDVVEKMADMPKSDEAAHRLKDLH